MFILQVYLILLELLIQCEDVATLLTPRPEEQTLLSSNNFETHNSPHSSPEHTSATSLSSISNQISLEKREHRNYISNSSSTENIVASPQNNNTGEKLLSNNRASSPIDDALRNVSLPTRASISGIDTASAASHESNSESPNKNSNSASSAENAKFNILLHLLHTYSSHIRLKPVSYHSSFQAYFSN